MLSLGVHGDRIVLFYIYSIIKIVSNVLLRIAGISNVLDELC